MPDPHVDVVLRRLVEALEASLPREDLSMSDSPTVFEAIDTFCLEKEAAGRSERTVDTYRQRLGTFAEVYGYARVCDIEPRDVSRYVIAMRQQQARYENHPHRPTEAGQLTRATVDGRIQSIKTFFKWCATRGYCEKSPAEHVERKGYDPSAESRAMEPDVLRLLIAEARKDAVDRGEPRNLAMLLFLADTACRVGELVSLELSKLDLEERSAWVSGKTDEREVFFTEPTARALKFWLAVRPKCRHSYVFCSVGNYNRGEPIKGNGVYLALKQLAQRAGVAHKRFNPHSIRHLVGQTYTDEANLELARKKLGHKDITTTARHYANQDRARMIAATEKLSLVNGDLGD